MANIRFDVPKDIYPEVILQGKSPKDIRDFIIQNNMVFTSPSGTAQRAFSAQEISDLRQEYQQLVEDVEPILAEALYETIEEQKRVVADAKDRLQAVRTQISDFVTQVKRGGEDYELDPNKVYRFAVKDKYLYYTVQDNSLVLAKVTSISENEQSELFDEQATNEGVLNSLR